MVSLSSIFLCFIFTLMFMFIFYILPYILYLYPIKYCFSLIRFIVFHFHYQIIFNGQYTIAYLCILCILLFCVFMLFFSILLIYCYHGYHFANFAKSLFCVLGPYKCEYHVKGYENFKSLHTHCQIVAIFPRLVPETPLQNPQAAQSPIKTPLTQNI